MEKYVSSDTIPKQTFFHYLFCSRCESDSMKIISKFRYVASNGGNIADIVSYNAVALLREKRENP